jgi:hypothetical protein
VHNVCQAAELRQTAEETTVGNAAIDGTNSTTNSDIVFNQARGTATGVMELGEAFGILDDLGAINTGTGRDPLNWDGEVAVLQTSEADDSYFLLADAKDGDRSPISMDSYSYQRPDGSNAQVYLLSRGGQAVLWNGHGTDEATGLKSLIGSGLGLDVYFVPAAGNPRTVEGYQQTRLAQVGMALLTRSTSNHYSRELAILIGTELATGGIGVGIGLGINAARAARASRLAATADEVSTLPQVTRNAIAGRATEAIGRGVLAREFPLGRVQNEVYLRGADGRRLIDPVTGQARRVDSIVIENGQVVASREFTSQTADKSLQVAKEDRIRDLPGGVFVRDRTTGSLLSLPSSVKTTIVRY